ncbi:CCR4-Not complex component Not1 C-terminal domain-containing protein [Plasmodiophora brassicae]
MPDEALGATSSAMAQVVYWKVVDIVRSASDLDAKAVQASLDDIVKMYGADAHLFTVRAFLALSRDMPDAGTTGGSDTIHSTFRQCLSRFESSPLFEGIFVNAFESLGLHDSFFSEMVASLSLDNNIAVRLALALNRSSRKSSVQQGRRWLSGHLDKVAHDNSLSEPVLHSLIEFTARDSSVPVNVRDAVLRTIRDLYPERLTSTVLHPVLYDTSCTNAIAKSPDAITMPDGPGCQLHLLLSDLGYSVCASKAALSDVVSQFSSCLTEKDVALCIGKFLRTHSGLVCEDALPNVLSMVVRKNWETTAAAVAPASDANAASASTWDVGVFVDVVSSLCPSIKWPAVFDNLDQPDFIVKDQKALDVLLEVHRCAQPGQPFPLNILFKPWKNRMGHLSLVRMAIGCLVIDFSLSEHVVRPIPGVAIAKGGYGMANNSWASVDLVRALVDLGESDLYGAVRALFNSPLENAPDLLLCTLAQVRVQNSTLKNELLDIVMSRYLRHHPSSGAVLQRVWADDPSIIVSWMVRVYLDDRSFLTRILDIAQDLKDALTVILEAQPFQFAIDLAILASRRDFLNLDKWLQLRLVEHGNSFATACLDYVASAITSHSHSPVPMTVELATSFISGLRANASILSSENAARYAELAQLLAQSAPAQTPHVTMPSATNAIAAQAMGAAAQAMGAAAQAMGGAAQPDKIEEEANAYFQKIYDGKMSNDEVISMLMAFKSSTSSRRENEIYACMIHNLFDEFRFFHKYPDKELRITAVLFGTLIKHELTGRYDMDTALRYIVDGLSSPPGSKLHNFGLWAIEEFKERLPEWPEFAATVADVPSLADQTELMSYLRGIVHPSVPPPVAPTSTSAAPVARVSATPVTAPVPSGPAATMGLRVGSSVNIDVLLESKGFVLWSSLPADIADRLSFIVNNVDIQNMSAKADELRSLLTPDRFGPFAHYIVVKRVTTEANFIKTYVGFLDTLKVPALTRVILLYTYEAINILIQSETIVSLSQERSLLKNLGSWLGMLTIKKNVPPLARYLKFPNIILDAYNQGRLIAVVPFVAKVLEHCPESRVFRPPNPWLMSLVSMLAEIYNVSDLKLNLKFEIEVLLNKLGITLSDVVIRKNLPIVNQASNPNFRNPRESHELVSSVPSMQNAFRVAGDAVPSRITSVPFPGTGPTPGSTAAAPGDESGVYVTINPNLALFTANPRLKACVTMAVDRAINEIISPVVERSVHIACITTRELVCKDFEMEADEHRLRKAAHAMVQTLTCALALVTCKEPLRLSISNHLRSLLVANNADPSLAEQAVQQVSGDNLDFGCSIIEKAASERAVRQIDETLQVEYELHRKAREHKQTYADLAFPQGRMSRYPSSVPEALRPRPGMSAAQLQVYDDFSAVRAAVHAATSAMGAVGASSGASSSSTVQSTLDQLASLLTQMHAAAATCTSLGDDPNIRAMLNSIQIILGASLDHEEVALHFTKNVFALYAAPNNTPIFIELYLAVLKVTCHTVPSGVKLVTLCAISADAQSPGPSLFTLNVTLMRGLLRDGLCLTSQLDAHYASQFASSVSALSIQRIAALTALLQTFIVHERVVSAVEFPATLDLLSRVCTPLSNMKPALRDTIVAMLAAIEALHSAPESPSEAAGQAAVPGDSREQYAVLFNKWMSICLSQSTSLDDAFHPYLGLLKSQRVLQSEATVEEFCRVVTLIAIESAIAQPELTFRSIDGFCKLIVCLVKVLSPQGAVFVSKMGLLTTTLNVVADVLTRDFERDPEAFNQRPYFRLIVNLLQDLNANDPELDTISAQILAAFAKMFHDMRPVVVPAFALAWLELISHRTFMPRLLQSKSHQLMGIFKSLLVDLLSFLQVYLRSAHLTDSVRLLYKGTLRVLLVLLHDFPEFLCSYHFSFCDVIPPSCIQMRNLILSAFPRHMRLPDPFLPNLKVDNLPEVKEPPIILSDVCAALVQSSLLSEIDAFMSAMPGQRDPSFFADLHAKMLRPAHEIAAAGTIYNVPVINAVVLYVGQKAIMGASEPNSAAMEIFQTLVTQLDEEGRYYLLNAIANQLRYPNNHTHYFSVVLLFLFVDATADVIQEQITRVLLERLIVHRPHPWGLLITFIELIKNPAYKFWNHEFTRCAPEIQRLFQSVARSCMPTAPGVNAGPSADDPVVDSAS